MASSAEIRQRYSCKRKPDVVTWLALFLFFLMIAGQIYLVILLPTQLQKAEALETNIAREQLKREIDATRMAFDYEKEQPKDKNDLTEGEVELVKDICDRHAAFLRANIDDMTLDQIVEMTKTRRRIQSVIDRWLYKGYDKEGISFKDWHPHYDIRQEAINYDKYVQILNERISLQEQIRK